MSSALLGIVGIFLLESTAIHFHFQPLFEPKYGLILNISKSSKKTKHTRRVHLVLINEVIACHWQTPEATDNTSQDKRENIAPFEGKSVVLGDNERQNLPVVPQGKTKNIRMCFRNHISGIFFTVQTI